MKSAKAIGYIGAIPPLHEGPHEWTSREDGDLSCQKCDRALNPVTGAFRLQVGTTAIAIADGAHPRRAKRIMKLCMAILEAHFDPETVRAQWGGKR